MAGAAKGSGSSKGGGKSRGARSPAKKASSSPKRKPPTKKATGSPKGKTAAKKAAPASKRDEPATKSTSNAAGTSAAADTPARTSDPAVGAASDDADPAPRSVTVPAGSTVVVQQQQQQDIRGPWYAFGLGGALLAYNAALFFLLLALTYAAGIFVVYLFILFLLLMFAAPQQSSGGGCNADCGCGTCCDGCCTGCDCGGTGCCDCGGCDCGGGGCDCGCASDAALPDGPVLSLAVLAVPAARRAALRDAFAHHPSGPAYQEDVFHLAGARLCVGCFTTYPVFLAAIAALSLLTPAWPWWVFLAAGAPFALAQAISSAGWARRRIIKVAVKAALGSGLALLVHGVLQAPWHNLVQAAALGGLLLLAMASALPRRSRLRRACAHPPGQ